MVKEDRTGEQGERRCGVTCGRSALGDGGRCLKDTSCSVCADCTLLLLPLPEVHMCGAVSLKGDIVW